MSKECKYVTRVGWFSVSKKICFRHCANEAWGGEGGRGHERPPHLWNQCGLRQGGPESAFLFAFIIAHILENLGNIWRQRGYGFSLKQFGGENIAWQAWLDEFKDHILGFDPQDIYCALLAFMDDMYIVSHCLEHAQIMLSELQTELALWGLVIAPDKLQFTCDKHTAAKLDNGTPGLTLAGAPIKRTSNFVILGSVVSASGEERTAHEHRIKKAWGVFWKWRHVLESSASLAVRLHFWESTVGRSMLYGLATCRQNSFNAERLAVAQRAMVCRMLKLKRRPIGDGVLEPWLDWQKRSLQRAKQTIQEHSMSITVSLAKERARWAGHISRFGTDNRPVHLLKCLLLWRNVYWWKWQQLLNSAGSHFETLRHHQSVGGLRRWEWHLSDSWVVHMAKSNDPNRVRFWNSSDSSGV